jgi:hypothetical protein
VLEGERCEEGVEAVEEVGGGWGEIGRMRGDEEGYWEGLIWLW